VAGVKGMDYRALRLRDPLRGFSVNADIQEQTRRQNAQVATLWPALATPSIKARVLTRQSPIRLSAHRYQGTIYIVAVNTGDEPVKARLTVSGVGKRRVSVWQEGRGLKANANAITDLFEPFAVHFYVVV
jgi:hypothetical protein